MERRIYRRTATGHVVSVIQGLGGRWIVGTETPGGHRRVKSPAVPECGERDECQANLDAYALRHGWPAVYGDAVSELVTETKLRVPLWLPRGSSIRIDGLKWVVEAEGVPCCRGEASNLACAYAAAVFALRLGAYRRSVLCSTPGRNNHLHVRGLEVSWCGRDVYLGTCAADDRWNLCSTCQALSLQILGENGGMIFPDNDQEI